MDFLWTVYGFANDTTFAVPVAQVALLVAIISFCLLLGRHRLGLVITLSFVFFWGFVLNRGYFLDALGALKWGLQIYILAGFLMIAMIVLGLFVQRSD